MTEKLSQAVSSSPVAQSAPAALPASRLAQGIWQALVLAVIMYISLACYLLVLKWRGPDALFTTHLPLDDLVPFQPGWVWVYLIPYVIGPVIVGLLRPATFRWFVGRGLTVVGLTLVIFMVMPTQTAPRPRLDPGQDPTSLLYENMVAIDDPPANAAPSLHVSLTFLLTLALVRDFPRWWFVTALGVGLVWLATLFTRQHHLLDVGSGILLASLVLLAWPRSRPLPSVAQRQGIDPVVSGNGI